MSSSSRKSLQEAVRLSAQSSECLKKTYSVILDSIGNATSYDDNGFLAQSLSSVNECAEKMRAVSKSLAEILGRSKPAFSLFQGKFAVDRGKDNPDMLFDNRYLRKAVNQSQYASEMLANEYELVLDALGCGETRNDNELLYQNLKIIEECKEKLRLISNSILEINESVERCELEVLYGPPPFFEND